ncbi:CRR6 family NdhI maturation factor [Geitlerinema sp. PCC 9228]|jgi:hypothetical protein|uniref:CRR6 family NdhI maturation factor n=1 Tax=Geitlerinema sp. PCC 9228 TaxID=111611 RepID=UPI0008F9B616|nr:CRR6 family NdhI maturation factor [Geitlerinema sp. PCC 9228]
MATTIHLTADTLQQLDLSPAETTIESWQCTDSLPETGLNFHIDYPREPEDPRELSEIPEVRLWFVRLDARYPWLPVLLDWKGGELPRYTAMLVPHEFHRTEGIQYNPEALEIFLMSKVFAIHEWLRQRQMPSKSRLMSMAQVLGYDLEAGIFDLLDGQGE